MLYRLESKLNLEAVVLIEFWFAHIFNIFIEVGVNNEIWKGAIFHASFPTKI